MPDGAKDAKGPCRLCICSPLRKVPLPLNVKPQVAPITTTPGAVVVDKNQAKRKAPKQAKQKRINERKKGVRPR